MISTDYRTQKGRQSNIELLRIVAMLMIVFHHFAIHGDFSFLSSEFSLPRLWYNFIIMFGKVGVNIFVLISGYFLITNKSRTINTRKILKLWIQIYTYSIFFFLLYLIFGNRNFEIGTVVKVFFPIVGEEWWFASTYFVLFLLHPYINILLQNLDEKIYQKLLLLIFFLWSFLPTFTHFSMQSNALLWFVYLYSLGGYIRLYIDSIKRTKFYLFGSIVSIVITYSTSILLYLIGIKVKIFSKHILYFYSMQTIFILSISIFVFLLFLTMNIKQNLTINKIASATFGVYLIHDNGFVRSWLWLDIFRENHLQNSLLLIPYSIVVVFIVYIGCTLIELARIRWIEKISLNLLDIIVSRIIHVYNNFVDTFRRLI